MRKLVIASLALCLINSCKKDIPKDVSGNYLCSVHSYVLTAGNMFNHDTTFVQSLEVYKVTNSDILINHDTYKYTSKAVGIDHDKYWCFHYEESPSSGLSESTVLFSKSNDSIYLSSYTRLSPGGSSYADWVGIKQ